jgi:hypothetical protein
MGIGVTSAQSILRIRPSAGRVDFPTQAIESMEGRQDLKVLFPRIAYDL